MQLKILISLCLLLATGGCPLLVAGGALADEPEPRTALVIGNGSYEFGGLRNPRNDASDMAARLRALGFEVIERVDQGRGEMKRAIRELGQRLQQRGGVGLFYYAGHGIQVEGRNYLIPIGASVESEHDVDIEAVRVDEVMAKLANAGNRMNVVILDACRNNPFARSFRSVTRGLAFMDAPAETLIAYATAPGQVAADGSGRNGVYTRELLDSMRQPGLSIEDVFKRTRAAVKQAALRSQEPWESTNLTGSFYFVAGLGEAVATQASRPDPVTPAAYEPATGSRWRSLPPDGCVTRIAIDPRDSRVRYAGTHGDGIFKSSDAGATWHTANDGMPTGALSTLLVDARLPGTLYVATFDIKNPSTGGIARSRDAGGHWQRLTSGLPGTPVETLAIDPHDPKTLYAGLFVSGAYKSEDGGDSWFPIKAGISGMATIMAYAFDPKTAGVVYAATGHGEVLRSGDGGASWTGGSQGLPRESVFELAVDPRDGSRLFAGLADFGLYESRDAGQTWSVSPLSVGRGFTVFSLAIDPGAPTRILVGADLSDGGAFESLDGGATWAKAGVGLEAGFVSSLSFDPSDPTTAYAASFCGGLHSRTLKAPAAR